MRNGDASLFSYMKGTVDRIVNSDNPNLGGGGGVGGFFLFSFLFGGGGFFFFLGVVFPPLRTTSGKSRHGLSRKN